MKTLESDRGDQWDHESVVTVHGVRASTIWRNQNKHCSVFGRGRLASIALPGQDEVQQMGRSWGGEKLKGGKLILMVFGSQPVEKTQLKLYDNSSSFPLHMHALKSCPKPMQQCAEMQGTRLNGPVAACCLQNFLGAVVGSQPSPWHWKASSYEELCSLWYNEEVRVQNR